MHGLSQTLHCTACPLRRQSTSFLMYRVVSTDTGIARHRTQTVYYAFVRLRAQRDGGLAPAAQLVLTASWLTMKEVALLSGALAASLPASSETQRNCADTSMCLPVQTSTQDCRAVAVVSKPWQLPTRRACVPQARWCSPCSGSAWAGGCWGC